MGEQSSGGVTSELAARTRRKASGSDSASLTIYDYEPVTRATHVRDFIIEFTFADGLRREIDFGPFLHGPLFEPLRSIDLFLKFVVDKELGTIVWPNGADIAPETLYHDLGPVP
jgi:hypothetical protein